MAVEIKVTGDVIQFDGYDIARLAPSGVPRSTMERFTDMLDGAQGHDGSGRIRSYGEGVEEATELVLEKVKLKAKAGLVPLADVQTICSEVDKELE